MKPNLGLSEEALTAVTDSLNALLADEHLLYTRLRNFHWNVTGHMFRTLHLLFEEQYTAVAGFIDEIAERTRSLGGRALGTLKEFQEQSRLKEQPGQVPDAVEMCRILLSDHETVIREMRPAIDLAQKHGDDGTADMLTGFMEAHTKMAWMLRATAASE